MGSSASKPGGSITPRISNYKIERSFHLHHPSNDATAAIYLAQFPLIYSTDGFVFVCLFVFFFGGFSPARAVISVAGVL
jgi:hypothetical protein